MRLRLAAAILLALTAACAQASALERFQAYVRTTTAARADFVQKVYDQDRRLVQESSGSFSFLRPGLFRWSYAKPSPQLIVGDGQRVWIYDEELKQVTVQRLAKAMGATPAALLAGADIDQAFTLAEAGESSGLEWLEARPREREAGFERIRLGLGVGGVEAMELIDHFGRTTTLRFSNVQRNPALDPSAFRFTPPKDADVLGER